MGLGALYGRIGICQGEGLVVVPGVPVVGVMWAKRLAGLAFDEIEGGVVQVGEVHRHTFGRTKGASDLFYGVTSAGLRVCPWTGSASMAMQKGKSAKDRVVDRHRIRVSVVQRLQISRRCCHKL